MLKLARHVPADRPGRRAVRLHGRRGRVLRDRESVRPHLRNSLHRASFSSASPGRRSSPPRADQPLLPAPRPHSRGAFFLSRWRKKKGVPLAPRKQGLAAPQEKERGAFVPGTRTSKLSARAAVGPTRAQEAARSRRTPASGAAEDSTTPTRCSWASFPPSQPDTQSRPKPRTAKKNAAGQRPPDSAAS